MLATCESVDLIGFGGVAVVRDDATEAPASATATTAAVSAPRLLTRTFMSTSTSSCGLDPGLGSRRHTTSNRIEKLVPGQNGIKVIPMLHQTRNGGGLPTS